MKTIGAPSTSGTWVNFLISNNSVPITDEGDTDAQHGGLSTRFASAGIHSPSWNCLQGVYSAQGICVEVGRVARLPKALPGACAESRARQKTRPTCSCLDCHNDVSKREKGIRPLCRGMINQDFLSVEDAATRVPEAI